jgi:mRNA interferase RelE/StbE
MPNSVFLSRQAEKFLSNLRDAALYGWLRNTIDGLTENAHPPGFVKLTGEPDLYRIRVGDYRLVYQVRSKALTLLVVSIGHRRDIYRK